MNLRKSLSAFFVLLMGAILFFQVSWVYAANSSDNPISTAISSAISSPISTAIIAVISKQSSLSPDGGSGEPVVCTDVKPASAPKLISAKQTGTNQVILTWEKAQGPVTYYMISYGLNKGTQMFGNPNVGDKNTTSYTVSNLSGNTTYYFRIRAGNNCMPGDFSNELAVKINGGKLIGNAGSFDSFVVATTKSYKNSSEAGFGQNLVKNVLANAPKESPAERIFQSFGNAGKRVVALFARLYR